MARALALFLSLVFLTVAPRARAGEVFLETESFADPGGWSLDTSFTHVVGSPYLLAHGLGQPVKDATTKFTVKDAGEYSLWARTKDWVAAWKAPGTPGRFQIVVNGEAVKTEFGTEGADWHWQAGGKVTLKAGENTIALRDLTGFDGRCDAIYLSTAGSPPPEKKEELAAARKKWLGLADGPIDAGEFDLVVIGGGYSGLGAAISGARQGLKVALIQDRLVLGGNGSSEIRVWANGGTMRGKYPHLGEIIEEFADHAPDSPGLAEHYGDALKEAVVRREKNISLFLGQFAHSVKQDPQTKMIQSVQALDVRTSEERIFRGKFFCDATGHAFIGAAAGAYYLQEIKGRMGMSNMFYWQHEDSPQAWPETPWALAMDPGDFPKQQASRSQLDGKPFMKGEWFWESGFDKDPINDLELIRDWNFRAVFGAFSALKHGPEKEKHANAAMKWVASVGGTRESRMLEGDILLTREDIVAKREFPDGTVPTTWDIDLHYPKEMYAKKFADNPFISRAEFGAGVDRQQGYPIPYRCFYSKNIPNLFMAGRCISVNHDALGTIRVMRTCGMMGEVVGKAAYLCVKNGTSPRGVYEKYLGDLLELCRQPGAMRRDSLEGPLYRDTASPAVSPYLNKSADTVVGVPAGSQKPRVPGISVASLPGIVVDDTQAKLKGTWGANGSLNPYVGTGYRYAGPGANATARFDFRVPAAGKYQVRIAWIGHENRASKAPVSIERAGQAPMKLRLNQKESPKEGEAFHTIGVFDFSAGDAAIVFSTEGADGNVHVDAVQLIEQR
ncbi:FAD dependent oxidoreductase [Caulifigura coniformis]|uniref:FAD dependent oxidoreductase n=1 Tax=Caulifigura coniformis TaxID=2527983 RepID=A0A517S8R7_9PLAN|nr:FAD-dependent oxidoreductase [Caulifigura coniformis]QDT52525.1 FAD dependent oxidoreductase [Caulifigura coniformis]